MILHFTHDTAFNKHLTVAAGLTFFTPRHFQNECCDAIRVIELDGLNILDGPHINFDELSLPPGHAGDVDQAPTGAAGDVPRSDVADLPFYENIKVKTTT